MIQFEFWAIIPSVSVPAEARAGPSRHVALRLMTNLAGAKPARGSGHACASEPAVRVLILPSALGAVGLCCANNAWIIEDDASTAMSSLPKRSSRPSTRKGISAHQINGCGIFMPSVGKRQQQVWKACWGNTCDLIRTRRNAVDFATARPTVISSACCAHGDEIARAILAGVLRQIAQPRPMPRTQNDRLTLPCSTLCLSSRITILLVSLWLTLSCDRPWVFI
jgi:hypothetical protein